MKHYFLGSNTPSGFVGFYNLAVKGRKRLFILKGSSGSGKHTFMKRIAAELEKDGITPEYCHCSNDPDSLDGVMFPDIGVGIIDGTSPHSVDPSLPGCVDEIVDLGRYIDSTAVSPYAEHIQRLIADKKRQYNRGYSYLKCARVLYDDTEGLIRSCVNESKFNDVLGALPRSLLKGAGKQGQCTHIFASAYTSKGYVDYVNSLIEGCHVTGIKNYHCLGRDVMESIYNYGKALGLNMTVCHSLVYPEKIDHILTDGLCILSVDEYNKYSEVDELISLKDCVDKDRITDAMPEIMWNNREFDTMVQKAWDVFSSCNKLHSELESIYIPAMDFDGADRERDAVLEKIRRYIH